MSNLYLISGLGADERVFSRLRLNPSPITFIKWEEPGNNESLDHYVMRLSNQIVNRENVVLVGLSFGGIIAQELSKIIPCKKVIIVSSIKSFNEMPYSFRLASLLKIHRMIPSRLFKLLAFAFLPVFFGCKTRKEKKLLRNLVGNSSPKLLKWSVDNLLEWKNTTRLQQIVHIHGTKDRIFPFNLIQNPIPVNGGSHFMVFNRAGELSRLINREI